MNIMIAAPDPVQISSGPPVSDDYSLWSESFILQHIITITNSLII